MRPALWSVALVVAAAPTLASADAVGPTETLYLVSGNNMKLGMVTGNTATYTNLTGSSYEYAIAASTSRGVQTIAYSPGPLGAQYTLSGTPTGTTYAYPTGAASQIYDGTTDGTYNYGISYETGTVYRFNGDWTGATALFNTGSGYGQWLGITYDRSNHSLWLSGWGSSLVRNVTMSGALIGGFSTGHFYNGALAMDTSGTLWLVDFTSGSTNLEGYSRAGALLHEVTFNPPAGGLNPLGGEFAFADATLAPGDAVPLPGVALAGLAIFGGLGGRRLLGRCRSAAAAPVA